MGVQVLVSSMFQNDYSLLSKMNIQTDAIIGNQCDRDGIEQFEYNGKKIKYLNFNERGVGLNRNNALMRADGEYCLLCDDDERLVDGYEKIITDAFKKNKKADVIIFNVIEKQPERRINKKVKRVGGLSLLRYGAVRVAFKLSEVKKHGIFFNQCFGGGTEHCNGEDSLFLSACHKAGLKIYTSPEFICELNDKRPSSWFNGYDEKYLKDKGLLFSLMYKRTYKLVCFQDAIRKSKQYKTCFIKAYRLMKKGAKQ